MRYFDSARLIRTGRPLESSQGPFCHENLLIRLLDVLPEKIHHIRWRFRYPFEHALAGLADFKPRLKTHGLDRVVDEVLSYGRESTACLRIVIV